MTFDDVAAYVTTLPDVVVGARWGNRTWMVGAKGFAWQRPLSKADVKRFGDPPPPAGELLTTIVESLDAKAAHSAIAPRGFFTIPHFVGYAAVLIALREARVRDVRAAILDAWRVAAPPATRAKLAKPAAKPRRKR